jgi:hypothetical protein
MVQELLLFQKLVNLFLQLVDPDIRPHLCIIKMADPICTLLDLAVL